MKIGDIATLKKFDQFAPFTVENVTVAAPASGLTVTVGSYYAGGAIGCATGGDVTNTNLTNLATVTAKGEAGGFIGFSGPGDAVGAGGLNVLGLIKLSGLLSVAQYSSVAVTASNVNGIATDSRSRRPARTRTTRPPITLRAASTARPTAPRPAKAM